MTQEEQTIAFAEDLDRLIDRYASEFELTIPSVIGVLELAKFEIIKHYTQDEDEN